MKLELFMFDTCPFCQRVLAEINRSGRTDIELHNVLTNPADKQRLITEGGQDQVPCLFIDGFPMYESADIVAWLQQHPQQ